MFFLTEPDERAVVKFISSQTDQPYTYDAVGATNGNPPTNYTIDHNRIQLGVGPDVFQRAVDALKHWRQFDLGWVSIVPEGVQVEAGSVVAVKARAFGSWSLSAARVVYMIDEQSPVKRFGFAYGTLTDHVEEGEERFLIEQLDDGSVWYDILAFSCPRHPLVRMSFPLARMLQKRFARDSKQRLLREVGG